MKMKMQENNEEQLLDRQVLNKNKESVCPNDLTRLGNQAVKMGLLSGHGFHRGKYEILFNGQIFLLSPEEAHSYLKNLVEQHQR